jgi:nucleoside diphosphate kinase
MAVERTLSILKPDATARNQTGAINALIEKAGLRIVAQKRVRWSQAQAERFYEVHKARPFYGDLVRFMTSGPIVVQVLEGENAVKTYRDVMGVPGQGRRRHHPQGVRRGHRAQFGARLRQHRQCRRRDRAELQARRDRRLGCHPGARHRDPAIRWLRRSR